MDLDIFKKDKKILHTYESILNDYVNWYSTQKAEQREKEKEQQYKLIMTVLTEGLNKNIFDISIYPNTQPYVYKDHIFKSYILKNKTKSLELHILTTVHKEYGELVYDTHLTLKSDSESIKISYNSIECTVIFKLIADYIFKNNLLQLLTTLEKKIYLLNFIIEKTKSGELIWEQVNSDSSTTVFQSEDCKYQFKYKPDLEIRELIINNDEKQACTLSPENSVKLINIITESIDCHALNKILTNLNNNVVQLTTTKQDSYLEN